MKPYARTPTIVQSLALFEAHRAPKRRIVMRFFDRRIAIARRELMRLKVKRALFAPTEATLP
jgi:hypothetical protein